VPNSQLVRSFDHSAATVLCCVATLDSKLLFNNIELWLIYIMRSQVFKKNLNTTNRNRIQQYDVSMLKLDMPSREHAENELYMVGATGENFEKIQDLKVMEYVEAMSDPRKAKVDEGIKV
jgi:hypothetical protein